MRDLAKGIVLEQADGRMALILANEIYQKEAVLQAAYKFIDVCHILIEPNGDNHVGVYFQLKPAARADIEMIALEFCNEVLDQQVRSDLERSYGPLRDMIVRQAFAPVSKPTSMLENKD